MYGVHTVKESKYADVWAYDVCSVRHDVAVSEFHRGEEVSAEVFDGPNSVVIQQGHHRLTAARGALAWVMEKS